MTARFVLKSATSDAHERLDGLMSRFDLATQHGYEGFLLAQAPAYLAVEAGLERAGVAKALGDWPERKRSTELLQDIAALGHAAPAPMSAPAFGSAAEMLGSLYVLEGSRLGASVLLRTLDKNFPLSFMSTRNPGAWPAFVTVLDQKLRSDAEIADAALAAVKVFKLFEASVLSYQERSGFEHGC